MFTLLCCLGAFGETEHHGGERMVGHSYFHHEDRGVERKRKGRHGGEERKERGWGRGGGRREEGRRTKYTLYF